jgi:hypothetical protein
MKKVKFKDLKIGDKFGCWGDQLINYTHAVWCYCIKTDEITGQEIGGIYFGISPSTEVSIEVKEVEIQENYIPSQIENTFESSTFKEIFYKKLLYKYREHVKSATGSDFIENLNNHTVSEVVFEEEEIKELQKIILKIKEDVFISD